MPGALQFGKGLGYSKLPQAGPEGANSLGALCMVCMARSLSKLPQAGSKEADNPSDLYTICMTKTIPDPFLALKIALVTYL